MTIKNLIVCAIMGLPLLLSSQIEDTADKLIRSFIESDQQLKSKSNSIDFEITLDHSDDITGVRHINALQIKDGIYVREGLLMLTYGKNEKLFANNSFSGKNTKNTSPTINAEAAIKKAMEFHGIPSNQKLIVKEKKSQPDQHIHFVRNSTTASDIQARLMYIQHKNELNLRLTWETQLHSRDRQHYWISYVDAQSGMVLESKDMVLHCTFGDGLVYDASPEEQANIDKKHQQMHLESARRWDEMIELNDAHASCTSIKKTKNKSKSASIAMAPVNTYLVLDIPAEAPNDNSTTSTQTSVSTAGDPTASPFGWTSTDGVTENTYTKGNNVYAFHDPSPGPLGGAPNTATAAQATAPGVFNYPWDLTKEPEYSTTDPSNQFPNRNAAIVNLFYWNNLVHDIFYNFGFTESGRNFQFDNFSKGGLGNDEVLAQAQDGGGTNNANFLTLADGTNGQMQMYLWTSSIIDSLVQIVDSDSATTIMDGEKFSALQGALYNSAAPIDLHTNPVLDKSYVLINAGCGNSEGCGLGGGVGVAPCNTVTGSIVLIDRGSCSFIEKVDGAQKGGAVGVIVMNNDQANPDAVLAMGGSDPTVNTITIPSVMVSYNTGVKLKAALASGANVTGSLKQDNPPIPKKDGDFDNGIIAHEYGHGISTRTSPQTASGGSLSGDEQGGEGWADYYALYLTTTQSDLQASSSAHPNGILPDRGIGTYVIYDNDDGVGIRPRKYSVDEGINEYTFAGSTNGGFGIGNAPEITIPHGIGFVWCTMLWEMTQSFVDEYGFNDDKYYNPPTTGDQTTDVATLISNNAGNSVALKLIQQGISMQSTSPRFVDMRDGILAADSLLYDAAHSCLIWTAFAKRGLGFNALDPSNNIGDEVDGFGVPSACNPAQVYFEIVKTSSSQSVENLGNLIYTISVTNTSPTGTSASNVDVMDILSDEMTLVSATGAPSTIQGDTITFTIANLVPLIPTLLTIEVVINSTETSTILDNYDYELDEQGWTTVSGGANSFFRLNDPSEAHGGEFYFFTPNTGTGSSNTMLVSPELNPALTGQQIRFWHKFDTDSGYDGGFLEVTSDGVNWTRLPLQENGYNGALNSLFNPANAGVAFTGTQATYMESAGTIPDGSTQLRFVFSEDTGGGGGEGWFIDDVLIVQNPVSIQNTATVNDPIASGGRTHTSSVSTLVTPYICVLNLLYSMGNIPDKTNKYVQNGITINGDPNAVKVLETHDVKLHAGNFIEITSGLEVEMGAKLLLNIELCPN